MLVTLKKMNKIKLDHYIPNYLFVVLLGFIFLLLCRNYVIYPTVFMDEYIYNMYSRLMPMYDSILSSHLYLKIYSFSSLAGDNYYQVVKTINVFFFTFAGVFIYLACNRFASRNVSVLVAILSISGPINVYTAYFMPESLFFFCFWFFSWFILGLTAKSGKVSWVILGLIYGLSSSVKPHIFLFAPAIVIYIVYISNGKLFSISIISIQNVMFFLFGALTTKLGIGYLLAGVSGLTIFGGFYNNVAASSVANIDGVTNLIFTALGSMKGHLYVMFIIYGLPIIIATMVVLDKIVICNDGSVSKGISSFKLENISLYAILVIANLVAVAALFTALVSGQGPYETPHRLHMRYYNFALPLLYIVIASALATNEIISKGIWRFILGIIVFIIGGYALCYGLAPYISGYIDNPEYRGFVSNFFIYRAVGFILLTNVILWFFREKVAYRLFIYCILPILIAVSSYNVNVIDPFPRKVADEFDKAGLFVNDFISSDYQTGLIVIGKDINVYRTKFYLDNPSVKHILIPESEGVDVSTFSPDIKWALVIGNYKVTGSFTKVVDVGGFKLLYLKDFLTKSIPVSTGYLHTQIGVNDNDGDKLVADGNEGFLSYGPYTTLTPGRWNVTWEGEISGIGFVEVTSGHGKNILKRHYYDYVGHPRDKISLELSVTSLQRDVEFRFYVYHRSSGYLENIEISKSVSDGPILGFFDI